MKNDSAGAVMVPAGYKLYLYSKASRDGQMQSFDGLQVDEMGNMIC
jgi:hypothetical protein